MVEVLTVDAENPETELIERAAAALRNGKLVAFPTETVYGLGANALDGMAVTRIFTVKCRPSSDPLIVHIASAELLPQVACNLTPLVFELAAAFWPGPLTLILPKQPAIPPQVTSGGATIAVRVPSNPIAQALLTASGLPVAAPSANRFGHTSPTTASHVYNDFGDAIDLIIDGGKTEVGIESTVLDLTLPMPTILRPGGVSREALAMALGTVALHAGTEDAGTQRSPGLLARHYSPNAELIFYTNSDRSAVLPRMRRQVIEEISQGRQVGLLLVEEDLPFFDGLGVDIASLGKSSDLRQAAQRLYSGIRDLDERLVEIILARDLGDVGLGLAIRDRLRRAAGRVVS